MQAVSGLTLPVNGFIGLSPEVRSYASQEAHDSQHSANHAQFD